MHTYSSQIVTKAWNYTHILRDDGLTHIAFTAQIAFPPFVRTADEMTRRHRPGGDSPNRPKATGWVDGRRSIADSAKAQVEHALQRTFRLRQAILKRAFEGKLVPQELTDKPVALVSQPEVLGRRAIASTGRRLGYIAYTSTTTHE